MTRDKAREAAKVLLAYAEGKTIQRRDSEWYANTYHTYDGNWEDLEYPEFQFLTTDYRVKPEPKVIWVVSGHRVFDNMESAIDYSHRNNLTYVKYVEVVE